MFQTLASKCIIKHQSLSLNPSVPETRIIQNIYINTMAADALTTCVVKASASMILTTEDEQILVFHEERIQLPVPTQFWAVIQNINTDILKFTKINSAQQGLILCQNTIVTTSSSSTAASYCNAWNGTSNKLLMVMQGMI